MRETGQKQCSHLEARRMHVVLDDDLYTEVGVVGQRHGQQQQQECC